MMRRPVTGFTLIELAIVTAIIGLLAAGAVAGFGAVRTNAKIKETSRNLHSIELLLQAYLARNKYLPCPADPTLGPDDANYGLEQRQAGVGSVCATARQIAGTETFRGVVPARSLGAAPRQLTDGWDHPFFYVVTRWPPLTDSVSSERWMLDDNAASEIELWDKANGDTSLPARRRIVDRGVVALISAGPNGNGAYTLAGARLAAPPAGAAAELDNQDADMFFVTADYSTNATAPFDDIVRVYTEDDLLLPLADLHELKTKQALTMERIERIVDAIYGFAATQSADPDGAGSRQRARRIPANLAGLLASAADLEDAWGQPIVYAPAASAADTSADSSVGIYGGAIYPITFTLSSQGSRANNPFDPTTFDDDIIISHTLFESLGRLSGAGIEVDP